MSSALVDRAYRRHAGAIVARLVRRFGTSELERVEAAVHDAFMAALDTWRDDAPENPAAWLHTVARRRLLDVLRRDARSEALGAEPADEASSPEQAVTFGMELADDRLRMMFVACHPSLSEPSQIALVLRTLCGFEIAEIAGALLTPEDAVEKRLVRARAKLRDERISFELPAPDELRTRLDAVLRVVYLLFAEGYSAHRGESPVREELCREAQELGELLAAHPLTAAPHVYALTALMYLQASRLGARTDADGELLSLAEQDRSKWNRVYIRRGLALLAESAAGSELREYHLEAGIAACHATAPSFEQTDWRRIVGYYDELLALTDSPVVRVNRAIALAYATGPARGLGELRRAARDARLADYGLLWAAAGHLEAAAGEFERSRKAYAHAATLAGTDAERRFLLKKLAELSVR